jgi:hypothetical protein
MRERERVCVCEEDPHVGEGIFCDVLNYDVVLTPQKIFEVVMFVVRDLLLRFLYLDFLWFVLKMRKVYCSKVAIYLRRDEESEERRICRASNWDLTNQQTQYQNKIHALSHSLSTIINNKTEFENVNERKIWVCMCLINVIR